MSKYYKAEDVIRAIAEQLCWIARTEYGDKFTTEDWLEEAEDYVSDLPTIEVSEDFVKDTDVPINEDCISREYLKSFGYINKGDFNSVETIREWIDNAPSVVPKDHSGESAEMVGEWIKEMHTNKVQIWKCDQCAEMIEQSIQYEYPRWNYCPNCGAKMKG